MKNLIFILIVFFPYSLFAAPPPKPPMTVEGNDITFHGNVTIFGNVYGAVSKTKQDDTYYVRIGGDDDNDCLTVGNACATPQGAIDKVPDFVNHVIVIDIGSGTFPAFAVYNKIIKPPGSLTIQGVLAAATLASGGNTGTFTASINSYTCQTAGETWTVNDLRGRILRQNSTPPVYSVIRSNTANQITFVEEYEITCGDPSYDILDHDTIINGVVSADLPITILIQSVRNSLSESTDVLLLPNSMMIKDLYAYNPTTAAIGVLVFSTYGSIRRMRSEAVYYGFALMGDTGFSVYDCYAFDHGYAGYYFAYSSPPSSIEGCFSYDGSMGFYLSYVNGYHLFNECLAEAGALEGIRLEKARVVELKNTIIYGHAGYGIDVDSTQKLFVNEGLIDGNSVGVVIDIDFGELGSNVYMDDVTIQNNTGNAITIGHAARLYLADMSGVGNGARGLSADHGSKVVLQNSPTMTGALGDFTINDGITTHAWSDAGTGDSVINLQNGTCVMGE